MDYLEICRPMGAWMISAKDLSDQGLSGSRSFLWSVKTGQSKDIKKL